MSLQKGFFMTEPFNPKVEPLKVVFTGGPGSFSFDVPNEYNVVKCEIAGASGGNGSGGNPGAPAGLGAGNGAIISTDAEKITNRTITGVVGAMGGVITGGSGYNNGANGTDNGDGSLGGGGGGSTSVVLNGTTYEASGGAGETRRAGPLGLFGGQGGNGGGPYGGQGGISKARNATDPNKTGLHQGNGYVKIYAGYDPFL